MAEKRRAKKVARRAFLKEVAVGGALVPAAGIALGEQASQAGSERQAGEVARVGAQTSSTSIQFPRTFSGPNLRMVAFPLGGIGTGTISLGGRGQLRDWEIFNRPDKGNSPDYCFPAIWAQVEGQRPLARVLEVKLTPPYEGATGLGAANVPGLPRLDEATFTGAYPLARIVFRDDKLPVQVSLEAFNPLVPLDVDASGLPVAILRYTVKNPNAAAAKVGVAFSVQNPIGKEGRQNRFREEPGLSGLLMENPLLPASDPLRGSMALCVMGAPAGSVSYLRGWKRAQWWDGPLTFWDDFTEDGALSSSARGVSPVGSICVTQTIPAGGEASVTLLLTWHFPNRTPERCGWAAVEGEETTVVGNYYTQRFADAWEVARHVARELPSLEARTRKFVEALETSTLPPAVLDAVLSNLSTLRTNTCFRTADGEFHGFEGCGDKAGCCHGSCTHVWNYEPATAYVFPSLARSLRESEFLRNTDQNGRMGFRSHLPDGKKIWGKAAADGQMGCLMKLYRDWQLSGDTDWLRRLWPAAERALEFAWIPNGWDADHDGVAEGVQHNTYDVEFYGPNPLCGVMYLGALRAGQEMARALGEESAATVYRRLFESGRRWIDANLFNGEYYIQKIVPREASQIADGLRVGAGAIDSLTPEYQMGEACLTDQLLGQYLAHVAGLGYLLDEQHVRQTLKSIFRYNYKTNLSEHEAVQRVFALNDEAAVVIASYPYGHRPEIPFPYFAEVMTGFEYQFAAHLLYEGMLTEALGIIESIRRRYDGERRNPWNEAECGHHYARAMASWAALIALSGFRYSAPAREMTLIPRLQSPSFRSLWSAPSGWGCFSQSVEAQSRQVRVEVVEGKVALVRLALNGAGKAGNRKVSAKLGSEPVSAIGREEAGRQVISFEREVSIIPGRPLEVTRAI